jgi:N-acetylglucosamine malate deacetylase 1
MNVLIVVAHPDDEVIGCGGTIFALSSRGARVHCGIMCAAVTARSGKPPDGTLRENMERAQREVGITEISLSGFPNIAFNTVPHLELVQTIERLILSCDPQVVITHHPADLNNDHLHTSLACQAAVRISQRRTGRLSVKSLLFTEILSSTDWSLASPSLAFTPTTFSEIGKEGLAAKLRALSCYEGVMRPYPHPRSVEAVSALATYRGGQLGMEYAEAFSTAFATLDPTRFLSSTEERLCTAELSNA